MPDEPEEDCDVTAGRPEVVALNRAGVVDFDEDVSTLEVVEDNTEEPAPPESLDRCDPPIPLVEEAESVITEGVALLEAVRPEVELGPVLLDAEELWT